MLWINPGQIKTSRALSSGVRFTARYNQKGDLITGAVFVDQDGDGLQGPTELALAAVSVIDPTAHQYFVPFDDRNLIAMLAASNACQNPDGGDRVGVYLASRISLTASADNTVYYYDHWEDDYDADPFDPGPSTEVGVLDAGRARVFSDDINTADPQWSTTLYYDGRDRITIVGEEAAVTRAAFPSLMDSSIGARLAGAWEVEETANWGTTYIIPVGEDWGTGTDFGFTGASVMALEDNTQVFINDEPIGYELDTGETYFVNGAGDGPLSDGLNGGTTFTANGPIQVHSYSSICDPANSTIWSGNGYALEPVDQWSSNYWSPVHSRINGANCKNAADVDIFLYNYQNSAIAIVVDDGDTYSINIPAHSSISVANKIAPSRLSNEHAIHIFAPSGQPFWGVVNMDTLGAAFEWGYSLIPEEELSSQVVVGWAPGSDYPHPRAWFPPSANMAWVTSIDGAFVFADFDQDGNADLMDCNGNGGTDEHVGPCVEPLSHLGVWINPLETIRIADPADADLTGALIYTRDLEGKIAVAWGQDPCVADGRWPYLDLGYTALPVAIPSVSKFDSLADDVDASGQVTPGDILAYTIVILNNGHGPLNQLVMTDPIPHEHTDFVVNSIVVSKTPSSIEYDDGDGSFAYTPPTHWRTDPNVQQFRVLWDQLDAQEPIAITFQVEIEPDISSNTREIHNQATVSSNETAPRKSEDPDNPRDPRTITPIHRPHLVISKSVTPDIVSSDDLLKYTIVISNVGTAPATDSLVWDVLPRGVSYVPNTVDLTWPVMSVATKQVPVTSTYQFNETTGDNFDTEDHIGTTGWNGNDGTLYWLVPWDEVNDDGGVTSGDVRVIQSSGDSNSFPSHLLIFDSDDQGSGLRRCADLSEFIEPHLSFQLRSATEGGDFYNVTVTSTVGFDRVVFRSDEGSSQYSARDIPLTDFKRQAQVCITFIAEPGMDGFPEDAIWLDDVFIYEASSARYETNYMTETTPLIEYKTSQDGISQAINNTLYITEDFFFPPRIPLNNSILTVSFEAGVTSSYANNHDLITNTAYISALNWPLPSYDEAVARVRSPYDYSLYLPQTLRRYHPLPAPVLFPIDNEDINGYYEVRWSDVNAADFYSVEECPEAIFRRDDCTSWHEIYRGPGVSYSVEYSDNDAARYFYRVKSCNPRSCGPPSDDQVYMDAWGEQEPNDPANDANGPLVPGARYRGQPLDSYDFYKFTSTNVGQVTIILSNYNGEGGQVRLYHDVAQPPSDDECYPDIAGYCEIVYTGDDDTGAPSGDYYILVYTRSGFTEIPYTIEAIFE